MCKEYHNRIYKLNEDKWDLELATCLKEYEINDMASRVNDQRGKLLVTFLASFCLYIFIQHIFIHSLFPSLPL